MDHHYFYIGQRGPTYVAAISLTEPNEKQVDPNEIVIGTVAVAAMQNPVQLRAWCKLMSEAADATVNLFFKEHGIENKVEGTETLLNRIPGVH